MLDGNQPDVVGAGVFILNLNEVLKTFPYLTLPYLTLPNKATNIAEKGEPKNPNVD